MEDKKCNPAKEFLLQYGQCERRFKNKLLDLEHYQTLATKATSVITGMPGSVSKDNDKMTDVVHKIIELQREANEAIDLCIEKKREVESVIAQVSDAKQRECLEKRYLFFMTWSRIAYEMNYATDFGATKLHGRALQSVGKILAKQNKTEKQ